MAKRFYFHSDTKRKCAEFAAKYGVHFSLGMSGKMDGVLSLSTLVAANERCAKNAAIKGSICEHCFARKTVKAYKGLNKNLQDNYNVLTSKVIPADKWPVFDPSDLDGMFRIESFGDVANAIQVINYFNLAERNPGVTFTAWTKSPDIYRAAIMMGHAKPANFILIKSSLFIDRETRCNYDFIDKTFTVYSAERAAAEPDGFINCGARSCRDCKRCYRNAGNRENVRELLK